MERGILIALWVTLPITAGGVAADALDDWATAPQVVAAVLLWAAWAAALLAIVIPRPIGLTALRAIAPLFAVLTLTAAVTADADAVITAVAIVVTVATAVLAARPAIAFAAVNAIAYGDEERFPLRVPPALFVGPLPLVRLALGAAVVAGPLLFADERWVLGAVACAIGIPVAVVAARALQGLSERWAVLVPAGFVVVDPLTLSDPVLFVREHIVTLRAAPQKAPADETVLDLRLGATLGSLSLTLDQPAEIFRATRARRGAVTTHASDIRVAVLRPREILTRAAQRKIPVTLSTGSRAQSAMPPPTNTSPA